MLPRGRCGPFQRREGLFVARIELENPAQGAHSLARPLCFAVDTGDLSIDAYRFVGLREHQERLGQQGERGDVTRVGFEADLQLGKGAFWIAACDVGLGELLGYPNVIVAVIQQPLCDFDVVVETSLLFEE